MLTIDWDAFSGTRELVFDAPIWGTADRPYDRLERWRARVSKRGGTCWSDLEHDFPLYDGAQRLLAYAGCPAWVTLSHADAWAWLTEVRSSQPSRLINLDSHHDLFSQSGDPARLRPGNWAGLALRAGLLSNYRCIYPNWHCGLPVAEGFDLERTWRELRAAQTGLDLAQVELRRGEPWPAPEEVGALLLVQSPAWTSPAHDPAFFELAERLGACPLQPPLKRP